MIKNFKQFESSSNTIEQIVKEITDKKPDIFEDVDEAMCDYVDGDWEDEYDSVYDAYMETGNGEAEDHVITELIKDWQLENGELSFDDYCDVHDGLKDFYEV